MAVIRMTQITLGGLEVNVDANARVTQENMEGVAINENTNIELSQIVPFVLTPAPTRIFRELFSPLTSHDED